MKNRVAALLGAAILALGTAVLAVPQASAAPGGCSYAASSYRPVLKPGNTGVAVKQAQCLGNLWGGSPKLAVDGVYGKKSVTKIKWIQGCHGLPKDGIIGPGTWESLYNPASDCYDEYPG